MASDHIGDNPSFEYFARQLAGMETLVPLMKVFGFLKGDAANAPEQLAKIRKQLDDMRAIPSEFNAHFAERGWIAYESMHMGLMAECVALANKGNLEAAADKLVDYYDEQHIEFGIVCAKNHPAFMERWEQMKFHALEDYKAGRYYACIPLLLMIIDGAVQDVDGNHGLASDGSDVQAWDSIAGHSSGLNAIKKIYTRTRKKTNSDPIDLPYRNGILHGRDLNYGNKKLAAKCWGILFAAADWAMAKESEGNRKAQLEKEKNPPPITETLTRFSENREHKKRIDEAQDAWEPREITPGKNCPVYGASNAYEKDSPERVCVEFLEWWQENNYGQMATMIICSDEPASKRRAGRYREIFDGKGLAEFEVRSVDDKGSGLSEVAFLLRIKIESKLLDIEHTFRLLYWDDEGNALPRTTRQGSWRIMEGFWDIEFAGLGEQ